MEPLSLSRYPERRESIFAHSTIVTFIIRVETIGKLITQMLESLSDF